MTVSDNTQSNYYKEALSAELWQARAQTYHSSWLPYADCPLVAKLYVLVSESENAIWAISGLTREPVFGSLALLSSYKWHYCHKWPGPSVPGSLFSVAECPGYVCGGHLGCFLQPCPGRRLTSGMVAADLSKPNWPLLGHLYDRSVHSSPKIVTHKENSIEITPPLNLYLRFLLCPSWGTEPQPTKIYPFIIRYLLQFLLPSVFSNAALLWALSCPPIVASVDSFMLAQTSSWVK